jgi:antitoxin MazE
MKRAMSEGGRITIAPIHAHPRAGWAEDAKRVAEAADDALVWPELENADDNALRWQKIELRPP